MDAAPDLPLPALSLVIPALNEAAALATVLREAAATLVPAFPEVEILVVDDGSTDATPEVVEAAAREFACVRLVRHPKNRGYGAALRTGFELARFDRVAFMDADGQFDPASLVTLVRAAEACPIVAGYRLKRCDTLRRRVLSRGYNLLVRTLLGTRVRDCDCALKVFHREVVRDLLPRSRGFFVNAEMLTRARQRGHAIVEVPVPHRPRLAGVSTVSLREVPRTLRTLAAFWWRHVVVGARPARLAVMRQVIQARVAAPAPEPQYVLLVRASEPRRPVAPPAPVRASA